MISVLIPTFKAAKYIRRALDSVAFQYFEDYEIIVCDNMSNDGTRQKCKPYTKVRFYEVKEEIETGGCGFSNCFKRCTGDIVILMGADDEMFPGTLRRISEEMKDNDWTYSFQGIYKGDEQVGLIGNPEVDFDTMLHKMSISISSSAFSRRVIEKYGFLDYKKYRLCVDYEFMLRLLLNGVKPKFVEHKFVKYNLTGENGYLNENQEEVWELKRDYKEIKKSRDLEKEDPPKIALITFATGKDYWPFAKEMLYSAKEFLKQNFDSFIFTDSEENFGDNIKTIPLEQHPWPLPTLMRYHSILGYEDEFKEYDYIFLIDSDMKFVQEVRDILSDGITATIRGMYDVRRGLRPPYEPNQWSTAYVKPHIYYAGGFVGGKKDRFLEMARVISENIDKDLDKGYMAIWNEESHLNKYLLDNPPQRSLDVSYCYPEKMLGYYRAIWGRDFEPKIYELHKPWKFSEKENDYNKKIMSDFVPKVNNFHATT